MIGRRAAYKGLGLCFILTISACQARADDSGESYTGRTMRNGLAYCRTAFDGGHADTKELSDCNTAISYLRGALEGYQLGTIHEAYRLQKPALDSICLPDNIRVDQAFRITLKYLDANPQRLHESATLLVIDSLIIAFPCSK